MNWEHAKTEKVEWTDELKTKSITEYIPQTVWFVQVNPHILQRDVKWTISSFVLFSFLKIRPYLSARYWNAVAIFYSFFQGLTLNYQEGRTIKLFIKMFIVKCLDISVASASNFRNLGSNLLYFWQLFSKIFLHFKEQLFRSVLLAQSGQIYLLVINTRCFIACPVVLVQALLAGLEHSLGKEKMSRCAKRAEGEMGRVRGKRSACTESPPPWPVFIPTCQNGIKISR